MTTILVTGGRKYRDIDHVWRALDLIHQHVNIDSIVHGAARGVDTFAQEWANLNGILVRSFRPRYDLYAPHVAPKIRNQQMLDDGKPDAVAQFPGEGGTLDMGIKARCAGVTVLPCWDLSLLEIRLQWYGVSLWDGENDGSTIRGHERPQ